MLSRESILAIQDLKPQKLDIPEWNDHVFIRSMTGRERGELEAASKSGNALADFRAMLAIRCVCDENGARLFSDADLEAIGKKSSAALDRILNAASKLNALGAEGIERAGER